jgi:hypothetical protein
MVQEGLFLKGGMGYSNLWADDATTSGSDGGSCSTFRGAFDGGSADVFQMGLGITFH